MTSAVLTRLNETRESYARRRALWRDLAGATPSVLTEIEAAMARADVEGDAETQVVREILATQRTRMGA
jgi:hypothetical protein